jgi:hypothetical protein
VSCPDFFREHRFEAVEPPEWMDTSDWDQAAWDDWYDQADQFCVYCGEADG